MKESYKDLYEEGFLPGPRESEEAFLRRVEQTKKILKNPEEYVTHKSFAKATLTPLNPSTLIAENRRSYFWQASSTSIMETKDGTIFPIISSPTKLSSLFVSKKEILAHELSHTRRCTFDCPKYEEILAYRTSPNLFRRYASPLFSSNYSVLLNLAFIPLSIITPILLAAYLPFLFGYTYSKQRQIQKCILFLKKKTPHFEQVLNGMTDSEIISLSKRRVENIDFSLFRWRFLTSIFGKIY